MVRKVVIPTNDYHHGVIFGSLNDHCYSSFYPIWHLVYSYFQFYIPD